MTAADARDLFAHAAWADAAVLEAAAALGADAWTTELGGSFPTLQAVLAHAAAGERVWLDRWLGASPTAFADWATAPTAAELRQARAAVVSERDTLLAGLDDDALGAPRPHVTFAGEAVAEPLADQIRHLVLHAAYHRGQAVAMLRRLGAVPPSTDYIRWVRLGRPAP